MIAPTAVAEARAWAIRTGAAREYAELCAAAGPGAPRLTEALLGLRGVAPLPVPATDPRLTAVLDALRYRTAAHLCAYGTMVVSVGRLLAEVRAHGVAPPPGFPDPGELPADLLRTLLARPPAGPPPTGRRRRIGPPPTLVFSSAGAPGALGAGLRGYLDEFRRAGHGDLRVLVVDDARATDAAAVDGILAAVSRESGFHLVRFAERSAGDGPGPKARFRAAVARTVAEAGRPDLAGDVARALAPDAAGSANAAFLALAGQPVVWLEQDARPYALRAPAADAPLAVPPPATLVERFTELPEPGGRREPVDVLHIVDRLLYGEPEYPAYPAEHPTWEDAGHEAVSAGTPTWGVRPGLCHFHVVGHPDYRARFSHNALTAARHGAAARAALGAGGLDRMRLLTAPPSPAVVSRGASAFGTVVGLHHELPLPAPVMAATRIRIIDFTVGLLLRAAGPCPAAWAATALTHVREPVTSAGRGRLAPYLGLEELLWPLYHTLERLLGDVPRASGEPAGSWLTRAGRSLEAASAGFRASPVVGRRLWRDRLCDRAVAAGVVPEDVAAHLDALDGDGVSGAVAAGRVTGERLRAEVRDLGRQLQVWGVLAEGRLAEIAPGL